MKFNIHKISLLLFLMILASITGYPQKKEMEIADAEFIDLQYYTAAENYLGLIQEFEENTPEKQHCTFMLAECYRMMNKPGLAEPYYKKLAEGRYSDSKPVILLRYANVLKTSGDVAGAKAYFKKYLKKNPENQEASAGLKSCDWLLANQDKKAQVNVWELTSLNSTEDDFGPAFFSRDHDQLVFTSNRTGDNKGKRDQWTGSVFSDLYQSKRSGGSWNDPTSLGFPEGVNTDIHEGAPSLNGDFNTMYFTRCYKMGATRTFCQIWKTDKIENSSGEPRKVFTDSLANIGQPSVSSDELTLVFSSDMPGGKGGNDLWIARRQSREEEFGKPVPLGPGINTAGDELFPYLFNDNTIFFSSDGYEGYGGLDIYKSQWEKNAWSTPENLLAPINSSYDDFGVIIKTLDEEGFFTSNRPGGKGGDDIYRFTRRKLLFEASGQVKDEMTLLSMEGVQVLLISEKRDTAKVFTDKQGVYKFDTTAVLEDHEYDLVFKKANYFSEKEVFSTTAFEDNHNFIIDVTLEPIPEQPIVLPDILYELDKWDLAPQYQDSLMELVELLNENESLVIELRSHTDSRASDEYNAVLSQKRAQSVVDFLVSQGVDPGRLVAKGYGEKIFRVLDKTVTRENYTFKAGTKLTDPFINSLPTKEIKEAAFQLNRRTEFAVLARDYKPAPGTAGAKPLTIQMVSDSMLTGIDYTLAAGGKMKVTGYLNDYGTDVLIDPQASESVIEESIVMDLLKRGAIDRNDFQGVFEEIMVDDQIVENAVVIIDKIRLGEVVINQSLVRVKKDTGKCFIMGKALLDKAGAFYVDEERRQLIFK